jgi:CBS domain containing-hemolysin-like protein
MTDTESWVLVGNTIICTMAYFVWGLGVARAVSKMNARPIRIFDLFFWPIALVVIAAAGEIA